MFHLNPAELTIVAAATAAASVFGIRAGRREAQEIPARYRNLIALDPEARREALRAEGRPVVWASIGIVTAALHYTFGIPFHNGLVEVVFFGLWLWSVHKLTAYGTSILVLRIRGVHLDRVDEAHSKERDDNGL